LADHDCGLDERCVLARCERDDPQAALGQWPAAGAIGPGARDPVLAGQDLRGAGHGLAWSPLRPRGAEWADLEVVNHSEVPRRARLEVGGTGWQIADGLAVIPPRGVATFLLRPVASLDPAGHGATMLRLRLDDGDVLIPALLPAGAGGRYVGELEFGVDASLGRFPVTLDIEIDAASGEVHAAIVAEESLGFAEPVALVGQDDGAGQVTLRGTTLLPGLAEGAWRSPRRLDVGRVIELQGTFSADGARFQGTVDETLSGLIGRVMIGRQGPLPAPLDLSTSPAPELPLPAPAVWLDPALFEGACAELEGWRGEIEVDAEGLLDDPVAAADACGEATAPSSSPEAAARCADALERLGDRTAAWLDPSGAGATIPDGWRACVADAAGGAGGTSCLDPAWLRCAGALRARALLDAPSLPTIHAWLDHLGSARTTASIIASGHQLDAGIAFESSFGASLIDAEHEAVMAAIGVIEHAITTSWSPLTTHAFALLDEDEQRERMERDVEGAHQLVTRWTELVVARLELERRRAPERRVELRRAASRIAGWLHVDAVVERARIDAVPGAAADASAAIFAEGIAQLTAAWRALDGGTNPLGQRANAIPLLPVIDPGDASASNFARVLAATRPHVDRFSEAVAEIEGTIALLEAQAHDASVEAEVLVEHYDAQLVTACGADLSDATRPDLDACGELGGSIADRRAVALSAAHRVELARRNIEVNGLAIEVQEAHAARLVEGAEDLEVSLQDLGGELLTVEDAKRRQISVVEDDRVRTQCARIKEDATRDALFGALEAGLQAVGEWSRPSRALAIAATAGVRAAQIGATAKSRCEGLREDHAFDDEVDEITARAGAKSFWISQEIDAKLRASALAAQLSGIRAQIETLWLANVGLGIELTLAQIDAERATMDLLDAYVEVAGLLSRRERGLARLANAPSNPWLAPGFLEVRDAMARRVRSQRERALRWAWLSVRALAYELNEALPGVEAQLVRARGPAEIEDVLACLETLRDTWHLAHGGAQRHVLELSLRRDVLGMTQPVIDPATGDPVDAAAQFQAYLASPEVQQPDGSLRVAFPISLTGGDAVSSTLLCNDRIAAIEVQVVGDGLGDETLVVGIERSGVGLLRACDPDEARGVVVEHALETRFAVLQAGVNTWPLSPPNAALEGVPLANHAWAVLVPSGASSPENGDLDVTGITDVVLRIHHDAGTVGAVAGEPFVAACP
jgi:hypothetical protein